MECLRVDIGGAADEEEGSRHGMSVPKRRLSHPVVRPHQGDTLEFIFLTAHLPDSVALSISIVLNLADDEGCFALLGIGHMVKH